MGVSPMSQSGRQQYQVNQYVLDRITDLANLPNNCAPGSTAIVIESGDIYMMGNEHRWIPFGASSGSGSGGSGGGSSAITWRPY